MGTYALEQALRRAAMMRQLRDVEIYEARLCRGVLAAAGTVAEPARAAADQHIRRCVANARKWNRQLVIAERDLRRALQRRSFAMQLALAPGAEQAVRS